MISVFGAIISFRLLYGLLIHDRWQILWFTARTATIQALNLHHIRVFDPAQGRRKLQRKQ
jgi:hypothetical protein